MKLCINCKYLYVNDPHKECSYPDILSKVDGKPKFTCQLARENTYLCGPQGLWFEEKSKEQKQEEKPAISSKNLFRRMLDYIKK